MGTIKATKTVKIELAGIQDIFNAVKNSKSRISAISTDASSASSKIGAAKVSYSEAKKIAENFINDLKVLDPELINSIPGKQAGRWIAEIESDLKTIAELQSTISRLGSITSKFII